jgi:hypothetical protein
MRRQTVERETPRVRPASSTVTIAPATGRSYHSRLTVSIVSSERPAFVGRRRTGRLHIVGPCRSWLGRYNDRFDWLYGIEISAVWNR